MLRLRYFIRLLSAYTSRFKGIIFLGIATGVLIFLFIRFIAPLFLLQKVEKIGLTGRYHAENLPFFILEMIGNGLTKTNESGEVEPSLSESWETTDKGKTWIFHLKEGNFWQDESKVISKDINYQFSDVTIERPDEKTVTFKLADAFTPFPSVVSRPIFKKGLLGTGDWKVMKISIGSGNYVEKLILKNKENAKKIYNFYPTEERTKLAYKRGEVDTLIELFNPTPFNEWGTSEVIEEVNRQRVVAIFFNTQDKYLSEKSLRQALTYAFDKKLGFPRAISPISPNSWVYNPQVKTYAYNTDRAKELIDDLPEEVSQDLSVNLVTTPALLGVAEKIAKNWESVGIKTTLQVSSAIPIEYQAFLAIFDIPSDPDQYSIWHSTQKATNISNYQNPRIDKLLEDGRVELDLEERRKIYLDFQRFLVEDSPVALLYHPALYTVRRK